jgi:hypothetical protein
MIRIIAIFFACMASAGSQEVPAPAPAVQISITTEMKKVGIGGEEIRVIALTITNTGDSEQTLVVGEHYNRADHWSLTAKITTRDGRIVVLTRLPRISVGSGSITAMVLELAPHLSHRALLDPAYFELAEDRGGSTNLASIIGGSGDQLQIVLHCGGGLGANSNTWKGDLVSEWLRI